MSPARSTGRKKPCRAHAGSQPPLPVLAITSLRCPGIKAMVCRTSVSVNANKMTVNDEVLTSARPPVSPPDEHFEPPRPAAWKPRPAAPRSRGLVPQSRGFAWGRIPSGGSVERDVMILTEGHDCARFGAVAVLRGHERGDLSADRRAVPEIDPSKPHSARIYDDGPFPAPAEVSCYGGVARKQ